MLSYYYVIFCSRNCMHNYLVGATLSLGQLELKQMSRCILHHLKLVIKLVGSNTPWMLCLSTTLCYKALLPSLSFNVSPTTYEVIKEKQPSSISVSLMYI